MAKEAAMGIDLGGITESGEAVFAKPWPVGGRLRRADFDLRRSAISNGEESVVCSTALLLSCFGTMIFEVVTPAKAGVQVVNPRQRWIPAFAGMTEVSYFIGPD